MLVLRKEIKIGIGAGLTILGIAGVYGLMASLSNSGEHKDAASAVVTNDEMAERQRAIDSAMNGLPPKPDEVADVTSKLETKTADPFAESARPDGNKADVWGSALTTGRVGSDIKSPAGGTASGPTVVKAPVTPRTESKLVQSGSSAFTPVEAPALTERTAAPAKTVSASTPAGSGTKYTIKPGDTFSTIAAKMYGNKKFSSVLVKANPEINPSRMKIGQEITVPPKDSVASIGGAIDTDSQNLSAPIDASRQYRVANGDTLSGIAQKLYGRSTQWQALYEANRTTIGPDEAKLKVGTLLELPQRPVR
ncbi:MAG TPA: LysM peptidoglycan-binding domain-containing protein [Tepidisphaeraceae bacterium]